jgi:hypothetical protein
MVAMTPSTMTKTTVTIALAAEIEARRAFLSCQGGTRRSRFRSRLGRSTFTEQPIAFARFSKKIGLVNGNFDRQSPRRRAGSPGKNADQILWKMSTDLCQVFGGSGMKQQSGSLSDLPVTAEFVEKFNNDFGVEGRTKRFRHVTPPKKSP